MKTNYLAIFAALSIMPALYACGGSVHDGHEGHEHEHEHEQHEGEHHHAEGEIEFSHEQAERFGVKTTKVTLTDFCDVITVSGRIEPAQGDQVTVVARSSGIVRLSRNAVVGSFVNQGAAIGTVSAQNIVGGDENENARITYEAARRELERITPLYEDKIVTQKEYNAAKEAFDKAAIAYSSHSVAGSTAASHIAGTITSLLVADGDYVETGAPIAIVSKNTRLILRADLPERYAQALPQLTSATFKTSYSNEIFDLRELQGHRVSAATAATATPGYLPVTFEFVNDGKIVPGSFAEVRLLGSTKHNCIAAPVEAITEEQGNFFVYVRVDDDCYLKNHVILGMNNGKEVQVLSGLKDGDELVTTGALMIKMASNAGAVPGHDHNH
ncbi:MAG: efflux RND transporter periplasmic adaptor subunit [Bacteroidales bacterium]|nr:efflux RND transporter periplasmic adaptor subunit [Bacteroidales bacterium]